MQWSGCSVECPAESLGKDAIIPYSAPPKRTCNHRNDLILIFLRVTALLSSAFCLLQLPHKGRRRHLLRNSRSHASNDSAAATALTKTYKNPPLLSRNSSLNHHKPLQHVSRPRKAVALRELASIQTGRQLLIDNSMVPITITQSTSASI